MNKKYITNNKNDIDMIQSHSNKKYPNYNEVKFYLDDFSKEVLNYFNIKCSGLFSEIKNKKISSSEFHDLINKEYEEIISIYEKKVKNHSFGCMYPALHSDEIGKILSSRKEEFKKNINSYVSQYELFLKTRKRDLRNYICAIICAITGILSVIYLIYPKLNDAIKNLIHTFLN
jgi:hypothetical protein